MHAYHRVDSFIKELYYQNLKIISTRMLSDSQSILTRKLNNLNREFQISK